MQQTNGIVQPTMEKLREILIKLASANLTEPLSSSKIALIDQCLHQSFPMILSAITELNQADGTSEDSISEYIKAKYDGLPWAHNSILRHHLRRLCDKALIFLLASDRYTIPGFTQRPVFTRVKLKGKQLVKRRVICPENSEDYGVQPQWSLAVKEEPQEPHHVTVEDSLINELSIPERVKFCPRKNRIKRLWTEEEYLADCSSGDEWMVNDVSGESSAKKTKSNVENLVEGRVIVFAISTKLAKPKKNRVPFSKFPSLELQKQDNLQMASIPSSQETKGNWPSWVPSLLKTDFYVKCEIHPNAEKNMYCSECKDGALCGCCVLSHEGHHVIKIKQANFEELVDVSDIDKYIDIKDIRTVKESSTVTAIVLKSVATWKTAAKNNSKCLFCKNRVPFPNKFCSLGCKFEHEHKVG